MYDRIVYPSGPLRTPDGELGMFTPCEMSEHRRVARDWAIAIWKAGWACLSPHLNSRDMDGIGGPEGKDGFLEGDCSFLRRLWVPSDRVVLLPGWRRSAGARLEKELAESLLLAVDRASDHGDDPSAYGQFLFRMLTGPDGDE